MLLESGRWIKCVPVETSCQMLSYVSSSLLDTTTHGVEVRLASQWALRTEAQSGYINGILLE